MNDLVTVIGRRRRIFRHGQRIDKLGRFFLGTRLIDARGQKGVVNLQSCSKKARIQRKEV
jgi:hypothetical protein